MPITLRRLAEFKRLPCYTCYDPVAESLLFEDDELAWDSFQTAPEVEPLNEARDSQENGNTPGQNQGTPPPKNSFGNTANVKRQAIDQGESYIELQEQLNDLSSEHSSKELPLPKTIGENQMKYLRQWKSMRDVLEKKPPNPPYIVNDKYSVPDQEATGVETPKDRQADEHLGELRLA